VGNNLFGSWEAAAAAAAVQRRTVLLVCFVCDRPAVGYTMDVMYFAWLPNPVEIDKAIQLPQFRLRRTVQYDCSQNYTGGGCALM